MLPATRYLLPATRYLLIGFWLLFLPTANSQQPMTNSQRYDVKTVQLTREGIELEPPVLTLGSGQRMLLQFDLLADEADNLRYSIAHCDADWRRDDLEPYEFISGFESGDIENVEFSFTTLRPYVHYHQLIPARYSDFTHSGNFIVAVTDSHGDTLLTRRFWVTEESAKITAEITRPYDGADIQRRQEVDVKVDNVVPRPEYLRVLVRQNERDDNARWLEFSGYDGQSLRYDLRQQNIFPGGNTFRFFDCSNLHTPMYNLIRVEEYGGELFAILRPEEDRSRKHFLSETTLNGGFKINIWDRSNPQLEADYVWVNISLPMAQPLLDGEIFVVGALTDWKLDSASRMDYNPEFKAYVKRLLLKQGYYAYQLLVMDYGTKVMGTGSATARLEGDHRETPNTYTVYLYHRSPSDRADRLLAIRRLQQPMN